MILFATDLDNTIIHSYKKADENKEICVELYTDGKKLSYMTQKAYEHLNILKLNNNLNIIPVTTRSVEQYQRIHLFKGSNPYPEYAVTSNGGILLVNNVSDEQWYNESLELIASSMPQLEKARKILDKHSATQFESRLVDGVFVFTKSDDIKEITDILSKSLDLSDVFILNNGEKIYVIPKILSKGTAIKRLIKKFRPDITVSAGDSAFDIPMLSETDISIIPPDMPMIDKIKTGKKLIKPDNCNFAEFICSQISNICEEFLK